MAIKTIEMKQKFMAFAALFVTVLSAAAPASAQSEAFESFVEKQFYGNRIKGARYCSTVFFREPHSATGIEKEKFTLWESVSVSD